MDLSLRSIFDDPNALGWLRQRNGLAPLPPQQPNAAPAVEPAAEPPPTPPAPASPPPDDTMQRFSAAQAKDRGMREQVSRGEFLRGLLGNPMDPKKLNVNAAGDVEQEVGLKHKVAGEAREAEMFPAKMRATNAGAGKAESEAALTAAKVPYAGREAAADASMKEAHSTLYGQQAKKGAADLEESESMRREEHDGQSLTSQIGADIMKSIGRPVPPGTPFASYKHLLPEATKAHIAEKAAQAAASRLTVKDEQFGTKREDDLAKRLNQGLDAYAMRGGLKGSMDIVNRAKRLKALIASNPNPDRRQIEEVAIGLNSLLSGSNTGAQRQIEALVPQSIWGDVKKLQERITNEPTGLDQQKFVARLLDTIEREEGVTADTVKKALKARLPEFAPLKDLNSSRYESILRGRGFDPELFTEEGLEKHPEAKGGKADPLGIR